MTDEANRTVDEILKGVQGRLPQGSFAYRWLGMLYSTGDKFTRLDRTFLYVLTHDSIRRVAPYRTADPATKEPYIVYTTQNVFRVLDGERRGHILPGSDLREEEHVEVAGICKKLRAGSATTCIDPAYGQDAFILDVLSDFLEACDAGMVDPPSDEFVYPDIYLCHSRLSHGAFTQVRRTGSAVQFVEGLQGYNPDISLNSNWRKLYRHKAVPAGPASGGRKGYPFRYVHGRGVLAASTDVSAHWHLALVPPGGTMQIHHPEITFHLFVGSTPQDTDEERVTENDIDGMVVETGDKPS